MANLNESKPCMASHDEILNDFKKHDGDFSKFLAHYSEVVFVAISIEAERLTKHDLYAIVHCITKMENVKEVEVSTRRFALPDPYELFNQAGFVEKALECIAQDYYKRTLVPQSQETATAEAKATGEPHSTQLIISLNEMKEILRKELFSDSERIKDITIFHFDEAASAELHKFLSHYSHLQTLKLSGKGEIDDCHLKAIGANLHQLQYLRVYMKGSISDEGICLLTGDDASEAGCSSLKILAIYEPHNITKRSIERMKNKLLKLEDLELWLGEVDSDVAEYTLNMKSVRRVRFRCAKEIHIPPLQQTLMKDPSFTVRPDYSNLQGNSPGCYMVELWRQTLTIVPSKTTE